nr:hypothetical protein [Tanacetum cinerariifolium]
MVVRASKRTLQAVIAAVDIADLAGSIASCLNVLLGTPQTVYANSVTSNDYVSFGKSTGLGLNATLQNGRLGLPLVIHLSFDKANRTYRNLSEGLN